VAHSVDQLFVRRNKSINRQIIHIFDDASHLSSHVTIMINCSSFHHRFLTIPIIDKVCHHYIDGG